jgi:hypothetical protein
MDFDYDKFFSDFNRYSDHEESRWSQMYDDYEKMFHREYDGFPGDFSPLFVPEPCGLSLRSRVLLFFHGICSSIGDFFGGLAERFWDMVD